MASPKRRTKRTSAFTPTPSPAPEAKGLPRFTPLQELTISTLDVEQVRAMLNGHDLGNFVLSGAVATHVLRDADLFGAILQRVGGLLGLPIAVEPAVHRATRKAQELAEAIEELWGQMLPRAALVDLVSDAVLLGFAVAQVVWDWSNERRELVPHLEPWPATHVQYRPYDRSWWAIAREGLVPITPGTGEWFLYTPMSVRHPQMWGALRCVTEWFLRSQLAASSASRYGEVRGQGVWIAEVPATAKNSAEARAWVKSMKTLGRGGVIPAPQTDSKATSYNVRVEEPKGNSYEIFDLLLRSSGARFRLAILGQNLTATNDQKHGGRSNSSTGENINDDVTEGDAVSLGDAVHRQLLEPWAEYQSGRRDLAPWAGWDAEPEEDLAQHATTLSTVGASFATWSQALGTQGRALDVVAAAERFGMPLLAAGAPTSINVDAEPEGQEALRVIGSTRRRFRLTGSRLVRI